MISLFLSIPLTLISVAGLLLNCYILIIVLLTKQVTTSANNLLLLHLGSVNIILGIFYLVFCVPGLKGTEWATVGIPCSIYGFFFTLLHPMVLWTICGLNCDRYYAIAAPLHYTHIISPRKILLGLGAGWTISLTLCIPPIFRMAPYDYSPGLGGCAPNFATGIGTLWYSMIYTAFTLILPAVVIICCNLKILMIARYHRHRIASAIYEVTLSAQVTITHQRNPFFVPTVTAPSSGGPKFRGRSAIYTVFQLVGSFLILYLPYYCLILWESIVSFFDRTENKLPQLYYTIASSLLVATLPVNSFLYGIKNKTLKKTFQNYWRKKQTKSEVNHEIQARTPSTCGSRRPSLTPLGFLTKPTLQRRLSETLLDAKSAKSSHRTKIKRIASELAWRPASANSLNLSPKEETMKKITQTASCNTLQVPLDQEVSTTAEDDIYLKVKNKGPSSTNLLLQKFFGIEQEKLTKKAAAVQNVLEGSPKRSPRILITRAFSEESDKTSHPSSPAKEITKKHSSSATTLIERKWRQLRYKDEDSDSDGAKSSYTTTKPLLDNSSNSNRSSDSSEASETSSGRIFMAIDNKMVIDDSEPREDQLLLSWNQQKKYQKSDTRKQRTNLLGHVQSQEIVL